MEYKQMTLAEWLDIKQKLKQNISSAKDKLNGLKKDFVRIGYLLRKIDDNELYKQDGYKSIAEFAKAECGLSPSDTTRFTQINKKYSIGGNSEELRPEFLEYGQSKLAAMLALPDADLNMITPQTSREDIRELNRFNKSDPEQGADDDIDQLIRDFYISQELVRKAVTVKDDPKALRELIAPGGSRSFRKGKWFIMFHENKINIKEYAGIVKEISWEEFTATTAKVLEKYELEYISKKQEETDGHRENREDNKQDSIRSGADDERNSTRDRGNVGKTEENENIQEPQQSETEHETDNNIPEPITEKNVGYPEKPEGEKEQEKEVIAPAQKPSKPALIPSEEMILKEGKKPVLRWEKMQHMSITEVAEILLIGYKSHHLTFNSIIDVENWLSEEMEK
ncbi:hypothetical protein [Anaerobutyricum soehngenii]|uniref:hypothetical protein n=1 Tax=Anaerobutyricum soehngenii TaxID=105843 RepID=UPI001C11CC5D|nr:hypothetical protein [Anaerobutyricum soehngenii]MBU5416515.1 hypothetical protein [Anaerobutyricum soehngenii]